MIEHLPLDRAITGLSAPFETFQGKRLLTELACYKRTLVYSPLASYRRILLWENNITIFALHLQDVAVTFPALGILWEIYVIGHDDKVPSIRHAHTGAQDETTPPGRVSHIHDFQKFITTVQIFLDFFQDFSVNQGGILYTEYEAFGPLKHSSWPL